ncbi:MAG: hypothetical protein WBW73_22825 [Rhodoplanes sp.]
MQIAPEHESFEGDAHLDGAAGIARVDLEARTFVLDDPVHPAGHDLVG